MNKIFILFCFFILLLGLFGLTLAFPYMAYYIIIKDRYEVDYYKPIRKVTEFLKPVSSHEHEEDFLKDKKYWQTFHIENYKVPVPVNHPLISTTPNIFQNFEKNFLQLGLKYNNLQNETYLDLWYGKGINFNRYLNDQDLFKLPIIRTKLEAIPIAKLWVDLFTLNLDIKDFWASFNYKYEDLAYNLYVLYLRTKYFPNNVVRFNFILKKNMGLMEVKTKYQELNKEIYWLYEDTQIESFEIEYLAGDTIAEEIRRRIIHDLSFSYSLKSEAKEIYNDFHQLEYSDKISQLGMMYLYSAWTHNQEDKEFLREIIRYLERGKGNLFQLNPLYVYAFQKYGTEFSNLREGDSALQTEEEKIIKREKNKKEENTEQESLNPVERMKKYLDEAKEKKNSDAKKDLSFD